MRIWTDPLERKKDLTEGTLMFLICTLCAGLLGAFGLYRCGIFPGSENTLLCFDMAEQFVSFFASLRQIAAGEASLFYSWSETLGGNYFGLFAYYLASPLSWLTCLWPAEQLPDAIYAVSLLKLSLCAGTMSLFLRGILKEHSRKEKLRILFLSLCYALSAATVSFLFLPMYLDAMILLPLICSEIRKSLRERKAFLGYPVFLGLCILIHYYSGFMVCIFAGLFALYTMCETGFSAKRILIFLRQSLCGVLIGMPVLLPVAFDLAAGKGQDAGVYSDGSLLVVSPLSILRQLLPGAYGSFLSDGAPEIYCTVTCFAIALVFLIRNRKEKQAKAGAGILLLLAACFLLRPLYRIWHGFRDPVAYPQRFAFLWCFFVILLAAQGLSETEGLLLTKLRGLSDRGKRALTEEQNKILCGTGAGLVMLLVLAGLLRTETAIVRGIYNEVNKIGRSDFVLFLETTAPLVQETQDLDATEGRVFSRTEADYNLTSNDGLLLGNRGMTYFSSTYTGDLLKLLKSLGLLQYHYKSYHDGSTIVTDSFFGIRYLLSRYPYPEGYLELGSNGFSKLCVNDHAMELGHRVSEIHDLPDALYGPENQNLLAGELSGTAETIFVREPCEPLWESLPYAIWQDETQKFDVEYGLRGSIRFTAPASGDYYLAFPTVPEASLSYEEKEAAKVISVTVNEIPVGAFTGYHRAYNLYLGSFDAGETALVQVEGVPEERELRLYRVDAAAYEVWTQKMEQSAFHTESFGGRTVSGTLPAGSGGWAVFTIPYDAGWTVRVNGEKVNTEPAFGAFLAVPVPEGEATITFSYLPKGLALGLLLAGLGILGCLIAHPLRM